MQKISRQDLTAIWVYLGITLALSSIFYFLIIYSGKTGGGQGMYATGIMWCPGISALLTMRILKKDTSELGWIWGKSKYQVWSYFIPIIYTLITYSIIWFAGWGGFYTQEFVNELTTSFGLGTQSDGFLIGIYVILFGIFGTIRSAANALGEEIGWRGFLVPTLYKNLGYTKTSLVSGAIWAAWHMPVLLFADYNSGTPSWYAMSCFTVTIISISFVFTWMRIKSGSLWTAVILHATHNLFIQRIFTPLTYDTGSTRYFTDEFGMVLPIISVGFGLYFWLKRKELN
jgi:membrane protease YdiL (CAAX protease family)